MVRKKGFTLIELLVVIAIIGLLLAILVPTLSKAKTYAEEIMCKSNLHQYSLATAIYCNDNKEKLPDPWESLYSSFAFSTETPVDNRYCRWHRPEFNLQAYADKVDPTSGKVYAGPYWPYLAATKVNICPTFGKIAPKYGSSHRAACIGGPFIPNFSYSMNALFIGGNSRKDQVSNPSKTFLWAEENMWTLDTPVNLSNYVLNDNALQVNTNPDDCFASYHKISASKLGIQRDSRKYEADSGVANVLMVDGSTEWVTPDLSLEYRGRLR